MSEWQPIESAPRDGTKILVAQLLFGAICIMQVCRFSKGKWMQSWNDDEMEPTHWMPLPEPPEGEQG